MTSAPLKFGLVGTGYWARIAHAPALAVTEGIELAGVWGHDPRAADVLAAEHGAVGFADVDALLAAVDGLAFAVPPDVQAPIAAAAARAGKHLMLEKPIALANAEADDLVAAVAEGQVASVVFFTLRFRADMRAWLADVTARGGWAGGLTSWFGSSLLDTSPFNTPWRRDKGALWDLAPHVIALLWAALGPVTTVTADGGPGDVSHLILHHQGGPSSTVTVSQNGQCAGGAGSDRSGQRLFAARRFRLRGRGHAGDRRPRRCIGGYVLPVLRRQTRDLSRDRASHPGRGLPAQPR